MSKTEDNSKGVRFADIDRSPSPLPAAGHPASAFPSTGTIDCRFGFLLLGGLYATDLLTLKSESSSIDQPAAGAPPPALRGLTASNLAVALEPGPNPGQQRLVLRLWADREGPFEADFVVEAGAGCEVRVHATATIFSRKKGTPGIKPHVRCLGFAADTDTEAASDWQGFA